MLLKKGERGVRGEFVIDGSVLNATRVAVSSRVSKKKKKCTTAFAMT